MYTVRAQQPYDLDDRKTSNENERNKCTDKMDATVCPINTLFFRPSTEPDSRRDTHRRSFTPRQQLFARLLIAKIPKIPKLTTIVVAIPINNNYSTKLSAITITLPVAFPRIHTHICIYIYIYIQSVARKQYYRFTSEFAAAADIEIYVCLILLAKQFCVFVSLSAFLYILFVRNKYNTTLWSI